MDYDENDYEGHNLQLNGEESSKFSPVLRPYALPKFDFDDSLQGHLRFDSLVENEVFLGIQSQDDSQWIEDFSRGNSGIEFSSSAADTCSISRRHNVWSEATSSESVEMLLKSVGQGEMVPGETIIEESDVCHELGSLTTQMEHSSNLVNRVDPEPALPPDELQDELGSVTYKMDHSLEHVDRVEEDIIEPEPTSPPNDFQDELGSFPKQMDRSLGPVDKVGDIIEQEPTLLSVDRVEEDIIELGPTLPSVDRVDEDIIELEPTLPSIDRVEEDIIELEPALPPNDFQDEVGSFPKQMDHSLEPVDKVGDIIEQEPTLPSDDRVEEDIMEQDDRTEDIVDPESITPLDEVKVEMASSTKQMDHDSKQDNIGDDIIDPEPTSLPDESHVELGSLTKQMDHNLMQDVRVEDVIDSELSFAPDEIQDELCNSATQVDHNTEKDDRMDDIFDPELILSPDEVQLSSVTKQIDHNLNQDDRVEDISVTEPALPGFKFQSQGAKIPSRPEGSSELESVAVNANSGSSTAKEKQEIGRECDEPNQMEVDTSVHVSANDKILEDHPVSRIQISSDDSLQNVVASFGELNDQVIQHQVNSNCFENANTSSEDICKGEKEYNFESQKATADEQMLSGTAVGTPACNMEGTHCASTVVECVRVREVEATTSEIERISSLPLKGDCDVLIVEGSNEEVYSMGPSSSKKFDVIDPSRASEITEHIEGNACMELRNFQGDSSVDEPTVEVSSTRAESFTHQELKTGSPMPTIDEQTESTVDRGVSARRSEEFILSAVENEPYKQVDDKYMNHAANLSDTVVGASAELLGKEHAIDYTKEGNDSPGVNKDSNVDDQAPPPKLVEPMQICDGSLQSEQDNVSHANKVPLSGKENENLPTEMEFEVGYLDSDKRGGGSPPSIVSMEQIIVADKTLEIDPITRETPALNFVDRNTIIASCDTLGAASVTSADEVIDHKEQTLSEDKLGVLHQNKQDGMEVDVPLDQNTPTPKVSSQVASLPGLVSEVDKVLSGDSASEKLCGIIYQVVSPEPVLDTGNEPEQVEHAAMANQVGQECFKKLHEPPVLFDSTVKGGDDTNGVAFKHHSETTIERNYKEISIEVSDPVLAPIKGGVVAETKSLSLVETTMASGVNNSGQVPSETKGGGNSADSDKPICNSPTVISCIGDMIEDLPLSEGAGVFNDKAQLMTPPSRGNDASKEERSFTFEVSPLIVPSEGETGKGWQSFPTVQACKTSMIVEGSSPTSVGRQKDPKTAISSGGPQVSDGGVTHGLSKGTPERKPRRGSAKKANHVKETTPPRQLEIGDKPCGPMTPLGSGAKHGGLVSTPASSLPDLNTSVAPALLQQPFTDLQQVQLRAQIFVYGSLIQGAVPDESYMVAAFGQSDGTRSFWEPVWRSCFERLHASKSHVNNSESPAQFRSGTRTPDQSVKRVSHKNKALSSSVGRASSKLGTPSAVVNPIIPLSSPLWNLPTPPCDAVKTSSVLRSPIIDYHQASLSPMNPYQGPMHNFVGHSPSWLPQASFPGSPWVASPQTSSFDANTCFSRFPNTESVKLTPLKESSVPISSSTKNASPIPMAHSGGPSIFDVKKVTTSHGQDSAVVKTTRKRKKVQSTEDHGQISLPGQAQIESVPSNVLSTKVSVAEDIGPIYLLAQSTTESVSAPVVSDHFSAPLAVISPARFASKTSSGNFVSSLFPAPPSAHIKAADPKDIISEESSSKVEEAMLHAEDAATHAATAISHCQGVWSQLVNYKNSGLGSDVEARLSSAAVAIAAATSVAKAAAAAAKIASNIAVQAKLMAEEALVGNTIHSMGNATPSTILKGGDGSKSSSSIIFAAKEAARKRVEAASVASKHAENLDALVKAAELAAEAVSQAGKIVAMGDPLPLSELADLGPEEYWRSPQVPSDPGIKSDIMNRDQPKTNSVDVLNVSANQPNQGPKEISRDSKDEYVGLGIVDGISGSVSSVEKGSRGKKGGRVSNLDRTIGVVPESEFGSRSTSITGQDEHDSAIGSSKDNHINEGSFVEVFKDDSGNCKAAWFSAKVLKVTEGKALVCYTELQSHYGPGKLEEWVPLNDEPQKTPKIRISHPMTSVHFEGARKRRRAAMTDNVWCVGDRVDAWVQDSWREGIISEKNQKDETTLTVNFPDQGESSVVRSWHIRPTLVWKDGEWIEWSSSRGDRTSQGDTPREKRLKPGSPAIEGKGKDKASKNINLAESGKHEEPRLLPLSTNEKEFNVGQNTRTESRHEVQKTLRAGLQKEGSGVIFGVPKPKRKFMEVSKHYTSERGSKGTPAKDPVKYSRYLMPQGSRWKSSSKVETKEKESVEPKPKVPRYGKPQTGSGRTLSQKDSTSNDESGSVRSKSREFGSSSNTEKAPIGPISFSSRALPPEARSKKVPSSNTKSQRLNNGKPAGNSSKVEGKEKSTPEVVGPRRSNRRIQPTSRLLEGLQTSLMVSKIPGISHGSHKGQNKGTPRGGNNNQD